MKKRTDIVALILRLSLGMMMLLHGIAKISKGVAGIERKMDAAGLPEFLAYTVFIGEVIAPVMLIIGYRTKIAAMLLAFTMLVAVYLSHAGDVASLGKGGGWAIELQALYFLGALSLVFLGGGKYGFSSRHKWD